MPARSSVLVGKDKTFQFKPLADARKTLGELLELYWQGLTRPLKLFPESSFTFAEAELKQSAGGKSKRKPLDAALTAWEGTEYSKGDITDTHIAMCFRNDPDPLDERFVGIARAVCGPMLAHAEEIK